MDTEVHSQQKVTQTHNICPSSATSDLSLHFQLVITEGLKSSQTRMSDGVHAVQ